MRGWTETGADARDPCAQEIDALGAVTRERELPEALAGAVERTVGATVVAVFLRRREGDELVLMASRGLGLVRRSSFAPGEGIVGRCAALGAGVARDPDHSIGRTLPLAVDARLDLAAPISSGGIVHGVLAVGLEGADARARERLETLGAAAGLALLHARSAGERLEARRVAELDPLTGLANKGTFRLALDEALRSCPEGEPVALLLFDIDHFKQYNDHHGHPAGDRVLEEIAMLVRRSFREGQDLRARVGGEEFAVLFPGTGKERAFALAERFRRAVEEHPFPFAGTQPGGRLTVSGGVAAFPTDAEDAQGLLEVADRWLYEAKRMSRNRISLADGEAGPRVTEITQRR